MVCRTCHNEFKRKTIKRGYIDQCDRCSLKQPEPPRYVGRMNEKCATMTIFRDNIKQVKKVLKRESSAGPRPSLSFTSYQWAHDQEHKRN